MLNQVRKDIVKLIYEKGEAHIGSCLSCVELLQAIKEVMKPKDRLILSKAHAMRVLDVIGRPEGFVKELDNYGGSLGNGIGIGLGMALASPSSQIYVLVGDGEMGEGSCDEAINYWNREKIGKINNLHIIVDCNGWGAYQKSAWSGYQDGHNIDVIKTVIYPDGIVYFKTVKGKGIQELEGKLESHYHKITKEEMERWTA